jgi:predicted P-loop ATPase
MVVFESAEGLNKSSALEILAVREEWFSDSLPLDANEQKVIEALQGKWIIEAPELKGMNNKSREHLKAFLSRKTDRARMSYGRRPKQFPRENIIVGTTNYSSYLGGNTGNRRILPNKITKFDLDKLRADRDQLWAEAAAAEATGESIRLAPELYAAAAGEQQRRLVEDPWVSVLDAALAETPTGKILGIDLWLVVDIKVGMQNQTHNQRLGEAMKALGWEHKKLRFDGEVRWGYAKGPEEEIKKCIEISRLPNEYGIPTHLHVEYREIHIVDERSDAKKKAREQEIPF